MKLFIYQIKQALLNLRRTPGLTISVVTTMGITLGALLCILTLAFIMLIKPLPYPDQEQLFYVEHQLINNNNEVDGTAFTYPNLIHLYKNQQVFEQSALMYLDADVITSLSNEPMMVINFVTPEWFSFFSIPMVIGRGFESSEQLNTYHSVAVLTYETWIDTYAGNPDILNQTISFGNKSYKIIGVTAKSHIPAPISSAGTSPQLYIPWDFNSVSERDRTTWGNDDSSLYFIGKTNRHHQLTSQVQSERLTTLVNSNWQDNVRDISFFKSWQINLISSQLKSHIIADSKTSIYLLLVGTLGLVVIALVNIANLLLSRTAERQQQLAISAAVGAKPKQLFLEIFAEISVLMLFAIILAQFVTLAGFEGLHIVLDGHLPRIHELELNSFSIFSSLLLLLVLTILLSAICQNTINYRALNVSLQSSGKGKGTQVSATTRKVLIASQVAVASLLIFINIILFHDAIDLINKPLGYKTDNTYAVVLAYNDAINAENLTELKDNLVNSPEISQVSQAMRPSVFGTFALATEKDNQRYTPKGKDVDHHYFSLIEQPIVAGDNFSRSQILNNEQVIIVNDVFARTLAPNGDAIGTRFTNGARVIGIVKSINVPGRNVEEARFYYLARLSRNMLLVNVHQGQTLTREHIITQLKAVDPKLSLFSFSSLENYKQKRLFSAKTTAIVTVALTIVTIFLSAIGLFGILKYSSQIRRFEIGTRMAIGAKGKDIINMVVKDNAIPFAIGIVASMAILTVVFLLFHQTLAQYLSTSLIMIFILSCAIITLICFVSCYLPLQKYIKRPAIHSLRSSE